MNVMRCSLKILSQLDSLDSLDKDAPMSNQVKTQNTFCHLIGALPLSFTMLSPDAHAVLTLKENESNLSVDTTNLEPDKKITGFNLNVYKSGWQLKLNLQRDSQPDDTDFLKANYPKTDLSQKPTSLVTASDEVLITFFEQLSKDQRTF